MPDSYPIANAGRLGFRFSNVRTTDSLTECDIESIIITDAESNLDSDRYCDRNSNADRDAQA